MTSALLALALAATDPRLAVLEAMGQELERGPLLSSPWQAPASKGGRP